MEDLKSFDPEGTQVVGGLDGKCGLCIKKNEKREFASPQILLPFIAPIAEIWHRRCCDWARE